MYIRKKRKSSSVKNTTLPLNYIKQGTKQKIRHLFLVIQYRLLNNLVKLILD
jgi:hypothetical protein